MSTPSTQDGSKNVRISADVHERLQRLSAGLNGASMNDTIAWLLSPGMVRIPLTPEQRERWQTSAKATGQDVSSFVVARVEAAMQYGADPGTIRRIHDMCAALTKAAGIIPRPVTPGPDHTVIHPKAEFDRP